MTSQQIEIFLEVASSRSFTIAAEKLYLSQPTVSRQMAQLEKEVGFTLFCRGNNYLSLTSEGDMLAKLFYRLRCEFNREIQKIMDLNHGCSGTLRLGFTSDMNTPDEFMKMVNVFKKSYPEVEVSYKCNPHADIVKELREGTVDIMLAHDMELSGVNSLNRLCVAKGRRGLYYSILHPLADKKDLKISDFINEVNLGSNYAKTELQRRSLKEITDFYGIPEFKTKYYDSTNEMIFHLRLGKGISIMDRFVLQSVPEDIRIIMVDESLPMVKKSLFWDKDNTNPSIALFCDTVRRVILKSAP